MIVVDKAKLRFLLAGRQIEIDVPREYRKGRSYALGTRHNKTICRAEVVEVLHLDAGYRLKLRRVHEDKPLYLAANPGGIRADYTTNPTRAAREVDGTLIEAVTSTDAQWLAKRARQASERDDLLRRERARQDRLSRWRLVYPKALQ